MRRLLLILIFFLGCTPVPPSSPVTVPRPDPAEPLALTVITGADGMTRLPGAEVFVIHATGQVERVGTTNQFGHVVIRRGPFLSTEAPAIGVMVCHPIFYCGLLRTEVMAERTEATIALATVVIR